MELDLACVGRGVADRRFISDLIAWVRSIVDLEFIEVTPETRCTLMITDHPTEETWEVPTMEAYLSGPLGTRDGARVAMEYQRGPHWRRHTAVLDLTNETRPVASQSEASPEKGASRGVV